MIENLKGIFKTVNFKENACIKLYDNNKRKIPKDLT